MAVGDILEMRVLCVSGDQIGVNVRHYRVNTEVAPIPTHLDIANSLDNVFAPLYKEVLSSLATFRGIGIHKVFPLPPTVEAQSTLNVGPGLRTGDILPSQTSGVVSLRTALAGRRFRGRAFIPFPAEVSNDAAGVPNGAYQINLGLIMNALIASRNVNVGLGSVGLVPVIYRRIAHTSTDIQTGIARTIWGTQRRRGSFGAANIPPF